MSPPPDEDRILAWLLGPKAENADFLESAIVSVFRDYAHWRRNYFPSDATLIGRSEKRQLAGDYDALEGNLVDLLAGLRRNFPFYSPRYLAHQLSDVTMASTIGYVAGLLYNANNVTPEAAPVTVEWELAACSKILKMLGYTAPPQPLTGNPKEEDWTRYRKSLADEFGWAHITSGGTVANIEALWVARNVRYFPLAARDVARKYSLEVRVRLPGIERPQPLRTVSERRLIHIRPNEAVYLRARLVEAFRSKFNLDVGDAATRTEDALRESRFSLTHGVGHATERYTPTVFASGAAHYSITKAADILGIGRSNVQLVDVDSQFRMDMRDLQTKVRRSVKDGRLPLAVVGVAGTTEEGAVDPLHKIKDFRVELERQENASFWFHIDSAWGGYFRTLFELQDSDVVTTILSRVGAQVGAPFTADRPWEWLQSVAAKSRESSPVQQSATASATGRGRTAGQQLSQEFLKAARDSILARNIPGIKADSFRLTLDDRIEAVRREVSDRLTISHGTYERNVRIQYGDHDTCSAFMAFHHAESITVDPHKMGYSAYPSGIVAFRNDRVRHFITEHAPYITGATHNVLVHLPPHHSISRPQDGSTGKGSAQVQIDAFAPFMLEGSKPGFVAAGLWLTTNTIPLDMRHHGQLVRESILAARELWEWLGRWRKICTHNQHDAQYEFHSLTADAPDTNIVVFVAKPLGSNRLEKMNELTMAVYERFSIQVELGESQYSYAQPFFLSRTTLTSPHYSFDAVKQFLERAGIPVNQQAQDRYRQDGVTVLRAAVMNPYIAILRRKGLQCVIGDFMTELGAAAQAVSNGSSSFAA